MTEKPGDIPKKDYFRVKNDWWDALIKNRIPGEQRQILDYIIRRTYGWQMKTAEISTKEFAQATDIKAPNVCRAIKSLKEKRLIIVIKSDNKRNATYQFNKHFRQWKMLSKVITPKNVIKSDNKTLSKVITPVIKSDNKTPVTPIIVKEQYKEQLNNKGFDLFWDKYPLKKSKKKAKDIWQSLHKKNQLPPLQKIFSAIDDQIKEKQVLTQSGKFCPEWKHPSTWLNQECWNDECTLEATVSDNPQNEKRQAWLKRQAQRLS